MRTVGAVVVLLAALLAGCSAGPDRAGDGGPGSPDLGEAVAFHVDGSTASAAELAGLPPVIGEQRFIGANSFEPTIGVDPSGAVFMDARFSGTMAGERMRGSFDQGATWQEVGPYLVPDLVTNPPASGDPFMYVDPVVGRLFAAHLTSFACSWITFSDDQGKTWTTNPAACGLPPGGDDHQSIVAAPSRGTPSTYGGGRLIHYCAQNNLIIHCAVSADGGVTFGLRTPVVIAASEGELPAQCTAASGHVRSDHEGRVFLTQVHCGTPVVVVSEDEGRTWTTHVISTSAQGLGYHMDLAADDADNLYAFWIGEEERPFLSVSRDHGTSWSDPISPAPPAVTTTLFPTIEAGGPGRVVVGYYGSERTDAAPRPWNAYLGLILDALAENPVVVTVTANPADDPIARECSGRCGGAGDFLDIALGPDGRPWMAITDVCHSACVTGTANDAGENHAGVATLASGPSLLAAGGALPPLTPVA